MNTSLSNTLISHKNSDLDHHQVLSQDEMNYYRKRNKNFKIIINLLITVNCGFVSAVFLYLMYLN